MCGSSEAPALRYYELKDILEFENSGCNLRALRLYKASWQTMWIDDRRVPVIPFEESGW